MLIRKMPTRHGTDIRVMFDTVHPPRTCRCALRKRRVSPREAPARSAEVYGSASQRPRAIRGSRRSGFDMLLGADFFLSHHVFIDYGTRRLFFTYNGGPAFDLSVLMLRAAIRIRNNNLDGARADFAAAESGAPERHELQLQEAGAYTATGRYPGARAAGPPDRCTCRPRTASSPGCRVCSAT